MRTTATVVGLGQRMTGVSKKNQKNFDFQSVSLNFPDKYTTGFKAQTALVNGDDIDALGGLAIYDELDIVYHTGQNGGFYLDAIISKQSPQ